jgi:hypothetical protein
MAHLRIIFGGLFVACVVVAVVIAYHGSVDRAVAVLKGSPLCVEPKLATIELDADGNGMQEFRITNFSDEPIRVLGAQLPCSCMTTSKLPLEVGSGQSDVVQVFLKNPKRSEEFRLNFLTDCQSSRAFTVVLSGS